MDKRVLGKSGIEVSPLGMGCMGITHASGDPMPDDEAVNVIRQACNMGHTFFDTAECYVGRRADGTEAHNEDVVGRALAPVRDEVVIATKFGVTHAPDKTILVDSRPEVSTVLSAMVRMMSILSPSRTISQKRCVRSSSCAGRRKSL